MSVEETKRKAEERERRTKEAYRHHSEFISCPKCYAYVRRDARICWKCGADLCE